MIRDRLLNKMFEMKVTVKERILKINYFWIIKK